MIAHPNVATGWRLACVKQLERRLLVADHARQYGNTEAIRAHMRLNGAAAAGVGVGVGVGVGEHGSG